MRHNDRTGPAEIINVPVSVVVLAFAVLALSSWAANEPSTTIHVAVQGDDGNPGTTDKPVATVQHAAQLVDKAGGTGEVVIHGGRYFTRVDLQNPKMPEGQPVPPLLIRAAAGEEVIFDGSQPLTKANPLAGKPGVFTFAGEFNSRTPPQVWEPATRRRYTGVADVRSVAAFPGTCALIDQKTAAVHTSDGRSPPEVGALASYHLYGIFSTRDNLTLRGLRFENYLGWSWAAGVTIHAGRNVMVEDCSAANCVRGFVAFTHAQNTRFVRCRVEDVGTGIYSGGRDVVVENCVLTKIRDRFKIDIDTQDDSAIQYYSPAIAGVVRGNIIRGFHYGIFLKSSGGTYVVEHNTVIDVAGAAFNNTWASGDPTVIRRNIFSGCGVALLYPPPKPLPPGAAFDENLCWSDAQANVLQANLAEIKRAGYGTNNVYGDPLFTNAEQGDYRVQTNSPAVALAKGTTPWGALPAAKPDEASIATLPTTAGVIEDLPEPVIIPAAPPRKGWSRVWHVALNGKDQPGRGSARKPLASLGYALQLAFAGDTVRIAPGLYQTSPIVIRRSGTSKKPIIIEAEKPDTVTLDGLKRIESIFTVEEASHVVIRNLNLRWFTSSGIRINKSSHVTVSGCRFINHFWNRDYCDSQAISVHNSPDCVFDHNIMARMGTGLHLVRSPRATVANNSATGMDYGGLWLIDSCKGSRVRNNSFCFAGNDSVVIHDSSADAFRSLDMDYNNWACSVGRLPEAQRLSLPFDYLSVGKAVILATVTGYDSPVKLASENRLLTMSDWRAYSGKDAHSIFADPKWIDPAAGRWELAADSPNLDAGEDGKTIGATDAAQ